MSAVSRQSRPSSHTNKEKTRAKATKQETMTPFVSTARLRQVQELLGQSSQNIDGILCILGIDGRYNEGSNNLANYLLFGFYDTGKPLQDKPGFDEDAFDDLMILVKPHSVHVYCHPVLYTYLIDYVSHWRNLRLHSLKLHEENIDEDKIEEFKIRSFVSMIEGCSNVGIPYTTSNLVHAPAFDKMIIEKWPIVQAFALDEVTGGGFFTLKHEVTDVGREIEHLYSVMDPVAMETLITKHLPLFERQWTNFLESLDVHISDRDFDKLTEDNVGEALFTYFKHGLVSESIHLKSKPARYPFILFGDNASRKNIENLQNGDNSKVTFKQKADLDKALSLMACQSVSPRGPLCCARTYSLTPLHQPSGRPDVRPGVSKDASCCQLLYSAVVEAEDEAMAVYAETLSVHQAESAALAKFSEVCSALEEEILQKHIKKSGNVSVSIKAYDKDGHLELLKEGRACPMVKTVTMTVFDVPSVEVKGKCLGSVIFAESFIDSTVPFKKPDGTELICGEYFVLTADIPRLITWTPSNDYGEIRRDDRWGKMLCPTESILATACNSFCHTPLEGKLTVWERALVFSHHQLGTVTLCKDHITALQLYDGDSPSKVAVLSVGYSPSAAIIVPATLSSPENVLYIVFLPRTKAYKNLFASILPSWKEGLNFPGLERIDELPESFFNKYDQLERLYKQNSVQSKTMLEKATLLRGNLKPFLDHLSVSSASQMPVAEKDLPVLLRQPVDRGHFENPDEILITIISGLPGSHKENLCQVLTNLAKEQNRWIIFKQPLDSANLFNPKALQQSLSSTLNVVRKKRVANSNRQPSLLILTPGYTDVIDVVKAIVTHPDASVKASYKIGAITCCVDPLTVYMEHRLTFPVFLNHCALGWVNNVVMTSSTSPQSPVLLEVQELIRSVNDDVAFILADNAQVTRSTDIELILSQTSFSDNSMVRARQLLTPGWERLDVYSVADEPVIEETILRFSQPIDRTKLVNKFKGLKATNKSFPFSGNVYHIRGRTTFTSNPEKWFELRYVVSSEKLIVNALDTQETGNKTNSNFVVFSGCDLKLEDLKTWMRSTARQNPEKKKPISRKDLTPDNIKDIHTKNHLTSLPEGWFYNGHQYMSLMGDRVDQHPDMEVFIERYIQVKNEDIKLFNTRIEENNIKDLFA